MLHRRTLLARAALACCGPVCGWPGCGRAGDAAPAEAACAAPDCTTLAGIAVPAGRLRQLATFPLGTAQVVVLGFAADLPEGRRDLLAVASGGQVRALELLDWQGSDGARLQTRLSAVPDRQRLRLERSASAPRGRGRRHEDWTDYLAWQEGAAMVDAPVRPVLAGTWQAALAAQRADMRALLADGPRALPPGLLARCPPPRLFT